MTDAFIYDHVRTPRGRGRPDGALHEVSSVQLAAQVLQALARRTGMDTSLVDDVILGCAQPVGEQGGNIARAAVLVAGYSQSVAGQQIHRFCASGLEAVNTAAAHIMAGQAQAAIGGGVESMSRTVMGADSGAWSADPWVAYQNLFRAAGDRSGSHCDTRRLFPGNRRSVRSRKSASCRARLARGPFCIVARTRARRVGRGVAGSGRAYAPRHDSGGLGRAEGVLRRAR